MMLGMEAQVLGLITAILFPLGMMALRVLTRERAASPDPSGVSVFEGDAAACHARLDLLADAGILAWLEGEDEALCVMVDEAQATEIPTLLATPPDARPELDGQQVLSGSLPES
jgi:hypothetical protein